MLLVYQVKQIPNKENGGKNQQVLQKIKSFSTQQYSSIYSTWLYLRKFYDKAAAHKLSGNKTMDLPPIRTITSNIEINTYQLAKVFSKDFVPFVSVSIHIQ